MGINRKLKITSKVLCYVLAIVLVFMIFPNNSVYAANVGVGTDGKKVNLSLWKYSLKGTTYCLDKYVGSIVDGKIVGSVPAKINGKPVTSMAFAFVDHNQEEIDTPITYCSYVGIKGLKQPPQIPNSVVDMSYTFSGCSELETAPKIPNSVKKMTGTFYGCTSLKQAPKIPNKVTNMTSTFNLCRRLPQPPKIPSSVTNMSHTFQNCYELIQAPEIPNGVKELISTFSGCLALTEGPKIPNSVKNMTYTFYQCEALTKPPKIPSSVTNLSSTFGGCSALTEAPEISNGVTNMSETFSFCTALTKVSEIPSSVTNVSYTFDHCTSLTQAPKIPNKVTNMMGTFSNCTALTQAPKIPESTTNMAYTFCCCTELINAPEIPNSVTNLNFCFEECKNLTGDICIPQSVILMDAAFFGTAKPIRLIYSLNSLEVISEELRYNITGVIDSNIPEISNVVKKDKKVIINATDNYKVYKYAITTSNTAPTTGWQSPNAFSNLSDKIYYAWAMDKVGNISKCKAFSYTQAIGTDGKLVNKKLWNFTCNGDTYSLNKYVGSIKNGKIVGSIPDTINGLPVTAMTNTFKNCSKLTQAPKIPTSVTDMYCAFYGCTGLTKAPDMPYGVTNMSNTFSNCTNLTGNIFIQKSVTDLSDVLKNTLKPITMIYSADNAVAASYKAPSNVKKAVDANPPEISGITTGTSNITIDANDDYSVDKYAITTSNNVPTDDWQSSNIFSNVAAGKYYVWAMDKVGNVSLGKAITVTQAVGTDGNVVDMNLWEYTCNGDTYSLDKYLGKIIDGKIVGSVPATINGKPVTVMSNTFMGCKDLISSPQLPLSITDLIFTFKDCTGLKYMPYISYGVTNMTGTFYGCKGLTQASEIPNSVTNMSKIFSECSSLKQISAISENVTDMSQAFSDCTSLRDAPSIPNSVTDMSWTFKNCTKLENVSEIPTSVTNINGTFYACENLKQAPVIPDGVTNMSSAFEKCTNLIQSPEISTSATDISNVFSGCLNLTGNVYLSNKVTTLTNFLLDTEKPITMMYSANNSLAASYEAQSNVTKTLDSISPEISDITASDTSININATDDNNVYRYAITTTNVAPTTGWQSSSEFKYIKYGRYYAWAMDKVGNISECKEFKFPQAVAFDADGKSVDMELWEYFINGDNTYCLGRYIGGIVDGKIIGSVPTTINGLAVTQMYYTFKNCENLIQAPEIPNSVTYVMEIFSGCNKLNEAPKIPNGVTGIAGAFSGCTSLKQAPDIPDSVTCLNNAFSGCTSLKQAPKIPNGVTDMGNAYLGCTGLQQAPKIPDNVTDMSCAFSGCTELKQAPDIPLSVTNLSSTFEGCTKLTGKVFIPEDLYLLSDIFKGTSKPITMIYSQKNKLARSYKAPSNVSKVVDSVLPKISSITDCDKNYININATDNYKVACYAITTTNTVPTSGWQSSNKFLVNGKYYAWAKDAVGNISACKAFVFPKV